MCIAYPYRIKTIKNKKAITDIGEVDLSLVSKAEKGNWILVKDNLAVTVVSKKEAEDMIELIKKTRRAGGANVC